MEQALITDLALSKAELSTAQRLEEAGLFGRVLEIGRRLEPIFSGREVWRSMAPAQQRIVGEGFPDAYRSHGSIRMWMRATNQLDRFRALVELAELLGAALPGELRQMKRAIGELDERQNCEVPRWDRDSGKLWFRGRLAREVRVGQGKNIVAILDEFQRQNWPRRIDSPLQPDKLHPTLDSLRQELALIWFRADGAGDGICWEML